MTAANEVRNDRRYTRDHEWALAEADGTVLVGITAFAVDQLGDITLVSLDVKPGDTLEAGKAFGTIESVKTLSDLYAPLSGTVARVNPALVDSPELINDDCWGKGWMVAIKPSSDALASLMSAEDYGRHVAESAH